MKPIIIDSREAGAGKSRKIGNNSIDDFVLKNKGQSLVVSANRIELLEEASHAWFKLGINHRCIHSSNGSWKPGMRYDPSKHGVQGRLNSSLRRKGNNNCGFLITQSAFIDNTIPKKQRANIDLIGRTFCTCKGCRCYPRLCQLS